MNIEEFHKALVRRPFQPFTIRIADGRALHVPHPEFVAHPSESDSAAVYPERGAGVHILDLRLVTGLDFTPPKRSTGRTIRKK